MNIAIIGANGFIGNRLVETLALSNATGNPTGERAFQPADGSAASGSSGTGILPVGLCATGFQPVPTPIVRQPSSLALPARFDLDCRIADALDADSLATAFRNCDAIVHCALGDPAQIEKMPAALITAAARANITRVVYLSSASVHGQNIAPGTTETTALHTRHALDYNNAKVRAERALFRHASRHPEIRVTALRPGIVFGPRSRWITDTAEDLRAGTAWLHNDGRAICNTIYIDNLVHAILLALTIPKSEIRNPQSSYLVADAEPITWLDFYAPIAAALNISPSSIPSLATLPAFPRTLRHRIEKTTTSPFVQKLLPLFPHRLKQSTKKILSTLSTPPLPDSWMLPAAPRPRITQELADLQRNTTRLPTAAIARDLGYTPPITFAEGMSRSLQWLRFARPDYF